MATALVEPVVLVRVRLDQQRAWFKRLDTWFADPKRRKNRVVVFDKVDDLLGPGAEHQVAAAATPIEDPLPLVRSSETLITNLLKIERFAPMIHSAEAAVSDRGEAWAAMGDNGSFDGGFILSAGNVYSLSPLTGALGPLCRTEPKSFPTSEWDESEDAETRRRFVQLLNYPLEQSTTGNSIFILTSTTYFTSRAQCGTTQTGFREGRREDGLFDLPRHREQYHLLPPLRRLPHLQEV